MSYKMTNHRWVQGWNINASGVLFGGQLMAWCDEDATMLVRNNMAEGMLATCGVDRVRFIVPATQGDRLRFDHEIIHVGKSSMTVLSKVWMLREEKEIQSFEQYTTLICVNSHFSVRPWFFTPGMKESIAEIQKGPQWGEVEELHVQRNERLKRSQTVGA